MIKNIVYLVALALTISACSKKSEVAEYPNDRDVGVYEGNDPYEDDIEAYGENDPYKSDSYSYGKPNLLDLMSLTLSLALSDDSDDQHHK
jgi:hypothetical protein